MGNKVRLIVGKIEGQGIAIQQVIELLRGLKKELIELGCKPSVKVEGVELEAGNGTRTRDILLGKKSVMVEGERVAAFGSTEEDDNNQTQCQLEHGPEWQRLDNFTNDGWSTTAFWCPVCGKYRYEVVAVVK
jgi:hypothetical protein